MNSKFLDLALFIFCALLSVSATTALFLNLSYDAGVGILAIAWSVLALFIILWVIERVYYYKKQIKRVQGSDKLSQKLITSMQRQKVYNQGMKALRSLNSLTISILISSTLYLIYNFWIIFNPQPVQSLDQLDGMIENYFVNAGMDYSIQHTLKSIHLFVLNAVTLLIIAVVFWLSQLYVYANSAARNVIWLSFGIFFLSFFVLIQPEMRAHSLVLPLNMHNGYGWGRLEVLQAFDIIPGNDLSYLQQRMYALGTSGAVLFYIPGIIMAVALIRNFFTKKDEKIYPALGILVLLVLLYVDVFYAGSLRLFSIWISGWSCLGILSIRNRSNSRRVYRIHQS